MIIKNVQTLVFEYPEDYQAEIEWNKKRDGDWVHQSTDTMCSVYTLTNNYLIPTKAKHSFLDNAYFEAEESEPQKDCKKCKNYDRCKNNRWKCCVYEPKDEPQRDCHDCVHWDYLHSVCCHQNGCKFHERTKIVERSK